MALFKGDLCDIWKPSRNVRGSGEVLRGTYNKLYSEVECQFQDIPTPQKLTLGLNDSVDGSYVVFAPDVISELDQYFIFKAMHDNTRWLVVKPVIHYRHSCAHWMATTEILQTWPSEVV